MRADNVWNDRHANLTDGEAISLPPVRQGHDPTLYHWCAGVGPGPEPAEPELRAPLAPGAGDLGRAVVGHPRHHLGPLVSVPAARSVEARHRVDRGCAGEQLDLGQSRVIVDRDVRVLPSGTSAPCSSVPVDPFADLPEAAEFLDLDMPQLTRLCSFVASDQRTWFPGERRAASGERRTAERSEYLADGGCGAPVQRGDGQRP